MGELYEKIEALCTREGITITAMCKNAGISRAPLSDLKMGRSKTLSSSTAAKIAAYFGVSMDYLLGNEKKPVITEDDELAETLEEFRRRPDLRALFKTAKKTTPEQVWQVEKMIKSLRGENDD